MTSATRQAGCTVIALMVWCSMLSASLARAQSLCFDAAVNYAVGNAPASVVAADLDGDGDQDLAVANSDNYTVSVLKNIGNGTFASPVDYVTGLDPQSVFAADLDGDGDVDLAVANDVSKTVSILKNNGDGTFAAAVNYSTGIASAYSVIATDLDGDGDQDLAVTNDNSSSISVLKNNGDGTFAPRVSYGVLLGPISICAADLDGDGDQDLAVANYPDSISVLKNNGNGTFASAINYAVGSRPYSVFASDLDGDGDTDLVTANNWSNSVSVLKNVGDGTFAAAVDYAAGYYPYSVFAADLDGDGDKDLAMANGFVGTSTVSVLKNNGDGTYASAVAYAVGSGAYSVFAADLDGDGDQDLAVTNWDDGSVSVLKNCLLPIVVTSLNDSGAGSLRSAIETANALSGPDTVTFAVAGAIALSSSLPTLSDLTGGTVIDGLTAPGASPGSPTVILDGSSVSSESGIDITSAGNVVRGLEIRGFPGNGITVRTGAARLNTFSDNRMYRNGSLGIDLGGDGVTPNDPGDGDSGPNDLLNFPVLDSTTEIGTDTFTVYGTSAPKSRVELYLSAEWGNSSLPPEVTTHGPAYRLLGSTTASVSGFFSIGPVAEPMWSRVTATATDTLGNTSEFSDNWLLVPSPLRITAYSELEAPLRQSMSVPLGSPAMQLVVISPPNALGKIDTIGPSMNTFGTRATYDSLTDVDGQGLPDTRVLIHSPDTGLYQIKYILIGDPGTRTAGIGIDGHAEVKRAIAFAFLEHAFTALGQEKDTTYYFAPPKRGELTSDGVFDVMDVLASVGIVFSGQPMPDPPELIDVNCDGVPDVFDVLYLINFVFLNGPAPCR